DVVRYCEWFGCQLPTERQWEFAAGGIETRFYPWGAEEAEPNEHRANFNRIVDAPTPVGMFPDGASPEGVADLAGNVWEWTRSDYDRQNRVVRGGAFDVEPAKLRTVYRGKDDPNEWFVNVGFRCIRE